MRCRRTRTSCAVNPLSFPEILLVQISFQKISLNADRSADLFYSRLFKFDAALRNLIKTDFFAQKRGFIRLLGIVVHRLDCFDLVRDHFAELALSYPEVNESEQRHRSIGAALFWMLEEILEDDFTPACRAAWMTIFRTLSDELKVRTAALAVAS